jgi:hypothetical protein
MRPFERVRDGGLLPWRGEVNGKVKKGYSKVANNKLVTTSYHVTNYYCTSSFRTIPRTQTVPVNHELPERNDLVVLLSDMSSTTWY